MRVAVCGSSGFLGTALVASLRADGHDVLRLVRREPSRPGELRWDPARGDIDSSRLAGVEAVVNLAGASTGGRRWTRGYKRVLRESRIRTTAVLASALAGMAEPPRVLVSASGTGYYGPDRPGVVLDEGDSAGDGFLARLCVDWEAATGPARAAGIAICHARLGIVIGRGGGALGRLLPVYRLGLGGALGDGRQVWSLVSLRDAVRALRFMIEQAGCGGPYNLTAPSPATNVEFTRLLASAVRRPRLLPAPAPALRLVLGGLAEELLGSLHVAPARLTAAGFVFEHPDAPSIVRASLAGSPADQKSA